MVELSYLYYEGSEIRPVATMTSDEFKAEILPYYKDMWRMAYAVLGNRDEAADAVQDAMVRLWSVRDSIPEISNRRSYCVGTARYAALRLIERRKEFSPLTEVADTLESPEVVGRLEASDMTELVKSAFDSMPPTQGEVMRMSSLGGMSNSEIAEATGLSHDNVRVILSRGRKKLKTLFSIHFDR